MFKKNEKSLAKISIILPCYNELANLPILIAKINEVLQDLNRGYEILIIDDRSPDGTYEKISNGNYLNVKIFLNKYKKGLAESIRTGIELSTGDIILLMDSDFNHSPEYIPIMITNLKYYDCVIGTRFAYGGSGYNTNRYILSWVYNIFIRIVTRNLVTDSLYGFLMFKKELLQNLPLDEIFYGFGDYCIRLMYVFQKMKITILQIPVIHGNRLEGVGNKKFITTFIRYTLSTLKLAFKRKPYV